MYGSPKIIGRLTEIIIYGEGKVSRIDGKKM